MPINPTSPLDESAKEQPLEIEVFIDELYENIFARDRYVAALELMPATRQDNELGLALRTSMAD